MASCNGYHGNLVRISLTDFSSSGVEHVPVATINWNLRGFQGGFMSGNYAYLVPYAKGVGDYHGYVARISLTDFSPTGVSYLNLADGNTALVGYRGGFAAGGHAWFVPYGGDPLHGLVARIKL